MCDCNKRGPMLLLRRRLKLYFFIILKIFMQANHIDKPYHHRIWCTFSTSYNRSPKPKIAPPKVLRITVTGAARRMSWKRSFSRPSLTLRWFSLRRTNLLNRFLGGSSFKPTSPGFFFQLRLRCHRLPCHNCRWKGSFKYGFIKATASRNMV